MTQTRKFVDATNEGKSVGLATIDVDVKHCDWNRIRLDQWKTIAQVTASENQINVLIRIKTEFFCSTPYCTELSLKSTTQLISIRLVQMEEFEFEPGSAGWAVRMRPPCDVRNFFLFETEKSYNWIVDRLNKKQHSE